MKKINFILFLTLLLSSCAEEVRFNSPSVQGLQNNQFWRALQSNASENSEGSITIKAVATNETLRLHLTAPLTGTLLLDQNSAAYASFEKRANGVSTLFSTQTENGKGRITITAYDTTNQTISGTFTFSAFKTDVGPEEDPALYFTQGVFYQVPVLKASN